MLSVKLLKILIPQSCTAFCAFDKFIVEGRKSKPCLVFILCIPEFYLEASVFLTVNVDSDNMYWE